MKKLIAMAAVMMAATFAKAELTLYWQVANYAFNGATYARLYGVESETETHLATMGLTEGAESTTVMSSLANVVAPFSDYSSYIVKLFDESLSTVVATSDSYAGSLSSYIYNSGTSEPPPTSPWQVSAFAVPEPTSGLLLLLGVAGLMLKRKLV